MKYLFILTLLISGFNLNAQGWQPMGGRSMSMANASITLNDVWGYQNNPGALADVDKFAAGVSYENRFLLKELQSQGFAVVVPLKVGVLSAGGQMYGYTSFRSYRAGLGYSMKLSEKFFAGVQMNYMGLQLSEGYGSASTLSGEAGIYAKVTENWKIGATVNNLGRAKLSDFEDDRFSTIMRLGTSYSFSKKVLLAFEVDKDLDYDPRFKTGIEYEVAKNFHLRGGFATAPIEVTFGAGYKFKQIDLNIGSAYHQVLGWSPHFSILFQGK